MGKFDLPASIDYILELTELKHLNYLGFSMGSAIFWIMMSLRPEYNDKVKVMVALAPAVYISNMKGFPKKYLAPFEPDLQVRLSLPLHLSHFLQISYAMK